MSSDLLSVRVIGGDATAAGAAVAAARRMFPQATVEQLAEWNAAAATGETAAPELLVFAAPGAPELPATSAAVDAGGAPRWAIVTASTGDRDGAPHVVGLPAPEWTEAQLAAAFSAAVRLRDLAAANARLRGDLRTVSRRLGHDVRSPLNCISTAGEAMKDPDEKPDSPRSAFAESIASSVDEVVQLVDRISFILKATASPVPFQPVIMEEIVWGALQRLESRLRQAGGTVSKPAQWPIVSGVPAWLDTIWSNLFANSLAHGGPKVRIELGWEARPGEHRFWIRDHGRGVPKAQAARLFHPLDRLSELNAPRGFGLPIVRRLVELQGGRCGHEPAATGSGIFYFTLPIRREAGEA